MVGKLLKRVVAWLLADHLKAYRAEMQSELSSISLSARNKVDAHIERLAALQALDVPVRRDAGKIIIMARVSGQDIVKIIDTPASMPLDEYKMIVEEVTRRYGARGMFIDGPRCDSDFIRGRSYRPDRYKERQQLFHD